MGPDRIDLFTVDEQAGSSTVSCVRRLERPGVVGRRPCLGAGGHRLGDRPDAGLAIFPDGELWNRYWDGAAWHPWESLGGVLAGTPAASSWSADRIDVFAPGREGGTWHRWWDGTRWVDWEIL